MVLTDEEKEAYRVFLAPYKTKYGHYYIPGKRYQDEVYLDIETMEELDEDDVQANYSSWAVAHGREP